MNISIDQLTHRQVEIADELWMCETEQDVEQYIATLEPQDQKDARALVVAMILAAAEQEEPPVDETAAVIAKAMR